MTDAPPVDDFLDPAQQAELLAAVATNRDRAAFGTLFAYFAPRVKSYLLRQGADDATADELVQDTMLALWRRADSFDRRRAAVSTWVFRIARNRRIDAFRKEQHPEFDPHDPMLVPSQPQPADAQIEAAEAANRLHAMMQNLPEEQASLLRRSFFDGMPHGRIAEATGLPLGTVKSRLRLALGRLREAVNTVSADSER